MNAPDGFRLVLDAVSAEQEAQLMDTIREELAPFRLFRNDGGRTAIRRYGWAYSDKDEWTGDCPNWVPIIEPLVPEQRTAFDSWTINEFPPGHKIEAHYDSFKFGDVIAVLNLGSDAVLAFSRGKELVPVMVPQRSLSVMSGESRRDWRHEVLPVPKERFSLVYRHRLFYHA